MAAFEFCEEESWLLTCHFSRHFYAVGIASFSLWFWELDIFDQDERAFEKACSKDISYHVPENGAFIFEVCSADSWRSTKSRWYGCISTSWLAAIRLPAHVPSYHLASKRGLAGPALRDLISQWESSKSRKHGFGAHIFRSSMDAVKRFQPLVPTVDLLSAPIKHCCTALRKAMFMELTLSWRSSSVARFTFSLHPLWTSRKLPSSLHSRCTHSWYHSVALGRGPFRDRMRKMRKRFRCMPLWLWCCWRCFPCSLTLSRCFRLSRSNAEMLWSARFGF